MKIRELSWANYRRMPDGRLEVRDHLVLVGPNDSGKSSVLRAVHLCLGMPHNQLSASMTVRDFTDPSAPLSLTVTLDGFDDEARAAFPDEISVEDGETLTLSVEATIDPNDPEEITVKRSFPDSGHTRSPSREQLAVIGFEYVPAVRSLFRELGGARGGAIRSLLSGLDLSADEATLRAAADQFRAALAASSALTGLRGELATALSAALPLSISEEDVRIVSESEIDDDPLTGTTVVVREDTQDVPLAEQSDGIRALAVLTLLGMSHKTAHISGIDEPETYLHPASQRALTRSLRRGESQRVLVTHSPFIVSAMSPLDIVALRADRRVRQLPVDAPVATLHASMRHWATTLIEPLTARRVLVVEGASDRILVERVAELLGLDLDKAGVAILELDGSASFRHGYRALGPPGFDLPLVGLLDEDARVEWADEVGVQPVDLESEGFVACDPDLEGVYIDRLGHDVVISMLVGSATVSERSLLDSCGVLDTTQLTRDLLWTYCRAGKHKVQAALAVAMAIDEAQARSITPLVDVLQLAVR